MAATSTHRGPRAAGVPSWLRALPAAAALSAYAGVLHLAVVPEHLAASWAHGAAFAAAGAAQLGLAAALLRRPRPGVVATAIAANVAIVVAYVLSRTRGLPLAPAHDPHRLEPAGLVDLAVTTAEVAVVALLVPLLPGRWRPVAVHLLLASGLALWGLRLVGWLG